MRRELVYLLLATLILVLMSPLGAAAKAYKVGVTVIVAHPALEADQKGFEKALADAGLEVTYEYQNAQGEMSNAQQIAQKFRNDPSIELVHAIATPTAQAACKAIKDKPVVYSSVTDPVSAGLVNTMGPDGGNVTGVSDAWPILVQLKLYTQMFPKARKWGTIYNAGDANSQTSIGWARDAAAKLGLELIEVTVSSSAEVFTAAQTLVGRVDAIYITSDNTVVSAFESVVKVCNSMHVPLFAGDTASAERGAIAALGFNYFQIGYTAGRKAALILSGKQKVGDIPSGLTEELSLYLNLKAARAQGLTVAPEYVKMAEKVFD